LKVVVSFIVSLTSNVIYWLIFVSGRIIQKNSILRNYGRIVILTSGKILNRLKDRFYG
jgi:hypothetical protein